MHFCPYCGEPLDASFLFCPFCGCRLNPPTPPAPTPTHTAPVPSPAAPVRPMTPPPAAPVRPMTPPPAAPTQPMTPPPYTAPNVPPVQAPPPSAAKPYANGNGHYLITFRRPSSIQMVGNAFHIKIDDAQKFELKNNSQIQVPLASGQHKIEISLFALPKKKTFFYHVSGNAVLICKPNPTAIASPLLAAPAKVSDEQGRVY